MLIGELAGRSGVSVKAVRYYESLGLIAPARRGNGYRDFDERDIRLIREIRELALVGVTAERARPFIDCLLSGHANGDDCPDSVAAYRAAIEEVDARIGELERRREALIRLVAGAEPSCMFTALDPAPRVKA
jgi:DNA-binding transcriptional MerR regulator